MWQKFNVDREEEVGNTLYVSGLSTRVTKEQLEEHFSKAGKVSYNKFIQTLIEKCLLMNKKGFMLKAS